MQNISGDKWYISISSINFEIWINDYIYPTDFILTTKDITNLIEHSYQIRNDYNLPKSIPENFEIL